MHRQPQVEDLRDCAGSIDREARNISREALLKIADGLLLVVVDMIVAEAIPSKLTRLLSLFEIQVVR
jgi:hypothetical protein